MKNRPFEWQTVLAVVGCYGLWAGSTASFQPVSAFAGPLVAGMILLVVTSLATAFHTSIQHEVVHGHPTPWPLVNETLIFPSLILVYPYRRYRDLHLAHHIDANLTDPLEDPESYYWAPRDKTRIGPMRKGLLTLNNSLAGRLILGPALGLMCFWHGEVQKLIRGEAAVWRAWLVHVPACLIVYWWVCVVCDIPFWLYALLVVYPAVSWILIRSFAEHRAARSIGARTAIVEAHPFFALLFLNNNLHVVHHAHPDVAWYELPGLYRERRDIYLRANNHLLYRGYGEIFRKFAFRAIQPVFHPYRDSIR